MIVENIKKAILQEAYSGKWSNNYEVWQEEILENLCREICTGNSIPETIKKSRYAKVEEGYNYIATKDLEFDHTFNYENGIKIPYDEPGFKYANTNDILLCIEGGSAGRKIGILEEKICYGNKLCKFEIKEEIDPKFLYYYLQSPIFLKNFYDNLSGIIGGVSISKIRKIKMLYPKIEEQKEIVRKIENIIFLVEEIEKIYK
jgi:type I restriction enzyme S subunit